MSKISLRLMTRRPAKDGTCPLYVCLAHKGKTAYIPTTIRLLPSQWDPKKCEVVGSANKSQLNSAATLCKAEFQKQLNELAYKCRLSTMTADQIKERIVGEKTREEERRFLPYFERYGASRKKANTRNTYGNTLFNLRKYEPHIEEFYFEDITPSWLDTLQDRMREGGLRQNSIAIHLRNIRAVVNDARKNDITTYYAFLKFQVKTEPTEHRAMAVAELRQLRDMPLTRSKEYYRDIFMLLFYLRGINVVDLYHLRKVDLRDGNIRYIRAKTGRPYTVRVEPEALAIITKYPGSGEYLLNCAERVCRPNDFCHNLDKTLQMIGRDIISEETDKHKDMSTWEDLTSYYSRHTWATIAAGIDVPKDTIRVALGHGARTVTDIYIDFDQAKVDAANRRVIDFLNGTAEIKEILSAELRHLLASWAGA